MTKTLTEQWRDGTLQEGLYYTRSSNGHKGFSIHTGSKSNMFSPYDRMAHQVEEVLSAVPDYEKVKEMSQKIERLEFDNEALEMAHNEGKEINAELEQYNKDLLQDHTRLVIECDGLLAGKKMLEKKLEIATKALERYSTTDTHDWIDSQVVAKKALKEIEEVK